ADQAILDCGVGREPEIAPRVVHDALVRLARLLRKHPVQTLAHLDDLARLDLDVRRTAARAAPRLVQQVARVRQREALLLRYRDVDQCARARYPPGADHPYRGIDEADHVVNRVARLDMTALRV